MKMTGFWDIAWYGVVELDRRFRGGYCPVDGGSSLSKTSTSFYQATQCNIPEGSRVQSWYLQWYVCVCVRASCAELMNYSAMTVDVTVLFYKCFYH
jgi:hypothetical protein